MAHTFTLLGCVRIAKSITNKAANAKDYLLTRKHDRAMKELAKEIAAGRGYILATDKELAERYPQFFTFHSYDKESKKMLWAIGFSKYPSFGNKMSFVPVR